MKIRKKRKPLVIYLNLIVIYPKIELSAVRTGILSTMIYLQSPTGNQILMQIRRDILCFGLLKIHLILKELLNILQELLVANSVNRIPICQHVEHMMVWQLYGILEKKTTNQFLKTKRILASILMLFGKFNGQIKEENRRIKVKDQFQFQVLFNFLK